MRLYTAAAIARALDMTEKNVRDLREKGVLTEKRPGLYDLTEATHGYINFLRQSDNAETRPDYKTERARLVKAKREAEELELKLKRGELHRSEDIEAVMTDMLLRFKSRMMALPAKLSPILAKKSDPAEVFKLIKKGVDEALEELADFDEAFGGEKDGAGTDKDDV